MTVLRAAVDDLQAYVYYSEAVDAYLTRWGTVRGGRTPDGALC